MEELKKVTTPPSQMSLLASVPRQFFETPIERFEPLREVCEGLVLEAGQRKSEMRLHVGNNNNNNNGSAAAGADEEEEEEGGDFRRHLVSQAIQSQLIERMETLDLMKDAVQNALSREVRKSSTFLVDSVQRIQDLDMEVTRATILTSAARRRLRESKSSLSDNDVRICRLNKERNELMELVERVKVLREAKARRDEVFEAERGASLATALEKTRAAMEWLSSSSFSEDGEQQADETRRFSLRALKSLEERLLNTIPTLRLRWEQEAREWFLTPPPPLDSDLDLADVTHRISSLLSSFTILNTDEARSSSTSQPPPRPSDLSFVEFLVEVAQTAVEYAFCVDARGVNAVIRNYLRASRYVESTAASPTAVLQVKQALAEGKTRIWNTLEATLVYLIKTPETRELSVEDFAALVRSCEENVASNRFFVGDQVSLSVSGAIRNRARAFALQTQAEG